MDHPDRNKLFYHVYIMLFTLPLLAAYIMQGCRIHSGCCPLSWGHMASSGDHNWLLGCSSSVSKQCSY